MVKEGNERIIITLTKKQVKFIRQSAKKLGITPSKFIKWLLDKNISHMMSRIPPHELDEIIKIAKFNWVSFAEFGDSLQDD